MSCGIVIAAAGKGKRMGYGFNKQFIELDGKPIIIHTIEKFSNKEWVNEIVVVANVEEMEQIEGLIEKFGLSVKKVVPGGSERQLSIEKGLNQIDSDFVMIHDGARPFIDTKKLDELYEQTQLEDAVVLGVPVKDTVKIVGDEGFVNSTPDRKSLWAIQTPQAFRVSVLKKAFHVAKEDGFMGTDDSSLVERVGYKVKVLLGDYNNIKITTPEDLITAELILKNGVEATND